MQPYNYNLGFESPITNFIGGLQSGQDIVSRRNQEARAAELHPLAVQGAKQNIRHAESQNDRANTAATTAEEINRANLKKQIEAANRRKEFNARAAALGVTSTNDDYIKLAQDFPELSKGLGGSWAALDEKRKKGTASVLARAATAIRGGNIEYAVQSANEYAEAADKSGDKAGAATAREMAKLIEINPDAAIASLGIALSQLDPKLSQTVFGGGNKVQSSDIIGGRVSVQQMSDGSVQVRDAATNEILTGEVAQNAIEEAEAAEAKAAADKAGARTGASKQAELESAQQIKAAEGLGQVQAATVKDALSSKATLASSIRNIDSAISAIDKGANSGVIYKRLPALSKETASLKNALDNMGLDVVGSVTFGALSEKELALAMEVAAPRNLGPSQLRQWLTDKKVATEKMQVEVESLAKYLSNPENSLFEWLNENVTYRDEFDAQAPDVQSAQPAQTSAPSYLDKY